MKRKIICIDEDKCNGCGLCADACHEGAIEIIDGKAKLTREDFCDGLGDCLPNCPTGAISFEEREAPAYNEQAVMENKQKKMQWNAEPHGCPGMRMKQFQRPENQPEEMPGNRNQQSWLRQWPCQMKLMPVKAPYYEGVKLLIAADCTAYAYAAFHDRFIKGHITVIGCPKLDSTDYSEKLTEIIANNDIKSVVIVRMEVPCCGGLENAARNALKASGKFIPWQVVTIATDGTLI